MAEVGTDSLEPFLALGEVGDFLGSGRVHGEVREARRPPMQRIHSRNDQARVEHVRQPDGGSEDGLLAGAMEAALP